MKTTESKAQRRHEEYSSIKRQARIAKTYGLPIKGEGYLRKHHATDCGTPGCVSCGNPRRTAKGSDKLTVQERRALQEPVNALINPESDNPEIVLTHENPAECYAVPNQKD